MPPPSPPATDATDTNAAADPARPTSAARDPLRLIAGFEALKGLAALAGMLGLLGLLHRDLHQIALDLIDYIPLDPQGRGLAALLRGVDRVAATPPATVMALGAAYVAVRWIEAWGLWHRRAWGEWFGALSGAVYVPFEVGHLWHHPSISAALVLLFNLAVVAYLGWRLWRRRAAASHG